MTFLRSRKVLVGLGILVFFMLVALFGPLVAPHTAQWQASTSAFAAHGPTGRFWLGTDVEQHDVFSQLLSGGRDTLLISLLAGAIATVLSVTIGVTAGYVGGVVDDLLSALTNIFLALPGLLILMVVLRALPQDLTGNPLTIGGVIALTAWAWGARVLRAQTLALRNQDYVEAARVIGERTPRIILFEIVPNLLPILASSFIFTVIYGIGTYATLAWLGLVGGSSVTWGTMLHEAQIQGALITGQWWLFAPPALCVAAVGVALALLNFGIDEIINPRLTSARGARGSRGHRVRFVLGLTPVVRTSAPLVAPDITLDLKKEVAQ
jgi:peptide/nickel transport system permease protein